MGKIQDTINKAASGVAAGAGVMAAGALQGSIEAKKNIDKEISSTIEELRKEEIDLVEGRGIDANSPKEEKEALKEEMNKLTSEKMKDTLFDKALDEYQKLSGKDLNISLKGSYGSLQEKGVPQAQDMETKELVDIDKKMWDKSLLNTYFKREGTSRLKLGIKTIVDKITGGNK